MVHNCEDIRDFHDWHVFSVQCYLNTTYDPPRLESECFDDLYCRKQVFCEDYLYDPAYVSVITAFWISLMGLYHLSWDHPIEVIRFLSACIVANGIFSALNHYTGTLVFSFLDNCTMYMAVYILFALILSKFLQQVPFLLGQDMNQTGICCKIPKMCCRRFGSCVRYFYSCRYLLRMLVWMYAIGMIVSNLYNDWQFSPNLVYFIASFSSPLIIIALIAIYIIRNNIINKFLWMRFSPDSLRNALPGTEPKQFNEACEKEIPARLQKISKVMEAYFARGVVLCIISSALWLSTESLCEDYVWPRYVMAHGLWHVLMSYGISFIVLFFTYLECLQRGMNVYVTDMFAIKNWKFCCKKRDVARKKVASESMLALDDLEDVSRMRWFIFPVIYVERPGEATSSELEDLFQVWREEKGSSADCGKVNKSKSGRTAEKEWAQNLESV